MTFSVRQLRALQRKPDYRHIRTRQANGRELTYLEGWYAISEANRIFGFDGWSRETLESRSVLARESKGVFLAIYVARVRITVQAEGVTIVREGHGSGEGRGVSPGEVHDIALKAAETDATKRALATFGKPFGLELYKGSRANGKGIETATRPLPAATASLPTSPPSMVTVPVRADLRTGFHPDDTTPIPRPSRYYGRRDNQLTQHFRSELRQAERARGTQTMALQMLETASSAPPAPPLAPIVEPLPGRIDKSQLAIAEPKRLRDKAHLKFVASQPCLLCGRQPSDPHHLRFAQPRAIGLKVSDEFTVPLCRGHHRQLHQVGNELAWWDRLNLRPLEVAKALWDEMHSKSDSTAASVPAQRTLAIPTAVPQKDVPQRDENAAPTPNER